ncbi:zinc finger, C2H2 type, partial [Opisthorchis viverrini]
METIFSVKASRNVTDGGIPCTTPTDTHPVSLSGHVTPKLTLSGPLQSVVKQQDPMNVNLSTHLSSRPTSFSTPSSASHAAHLIHFTDDFDLPSMKPIGGSPLMDDDDDDMRSLLAAAAAVAASVSPGSPHLRSSSSGLNTPPDTRVCRPLDVELDGSVKTNVERSEHGLHTAGGAALLVSRLNSTAAALAKAEDPLGLQLIPSNTSIGGFSPNNAMENYTSTLGVSSPASQFFTISSSLTSECRILPTSRDSPLHTNSLASSIKFPSPSRDPFICNSTFVRETSSPSTLSTPPQPHPKQSFVDFDVPCQNQRHSAETVATTTCSSFPTAPSHYSQPNFGRVTDASVVRSVAATTAVSDSTWACPTSPLLLPTTVLSDKQGISPNTVGPNSHIPTTSVSSPFPHDDCFPITSTLPLKTESPTRIAALVTSETVLTNKMTLATVDNKPPRNSCDTPVYPSSNLHTLGGRNTPSRSTDNSVPSIPAVDHQFGDMDSNANKTQPAVNSENRNITCDHSPTTNNSPYSGSGPAQSDLVHSPGSQLNFLNSHAPDTLGSHSGELCFLNRDASKSNDISDIDVLISTAEEPSPIPNNTVNNGDHPDEDTACDEAEYVSAAVAAVEDVVYALAGNRKPDPALEVDPSLEGTGTDRILTLSLAPINTSSVLSNSGLEASVNGSSSALHNTVSSHNSKESSENISPNGMDEAPDSQTTTSAVNIAPSTNWERLDNKGDFPCSACNRVFSQKALLLKHRIMHDEPKHTCDTCGRCFVREDKLKRHVMSIHTTEKPHVCGICTKAFSRKDKLKDHLKHHERAARNFECQQCQQPFVQKSDLNRHIRGVHQGEPGVGINMGTKRRAPGLAPVKLNKKKSKSNGSLISAGNTSPSSADQLASQPNRIALKSVNGRSSQASACLRTKLEDGGSPSQPSSTVLDSSLSANSVTASIAAAAAAAGLNTFPPAPTAHASTPVFVTGAASGLMLPTMTLTQAAAQHHLVQQQQAAAAAAAAVMLPGGAMTTITQATHPSVFALQHQQHQQALQQQQQQFFAMAAVPTNLTQSSATAQEQQQRQQSAASAVQQQFHLQPELKAVATPSGPMMVWTRIAAANQAAQAHPLQVVGAGQAGVANLQASPVQQFQLHQQAQQIQQQQAAALAARQQAAHNLLFPTSGSAAGTAPASFFCNPTEGMPAGLILASSADPASFALAAAAQAQAAAAAAAAQQQTGATNGTVLPAVSANALSASALAAATGLQVVAGYSDAQHAVAHQQAQQQQLLLQQQHQQRLAAVAAAASAVQPNGVPTSNSVTTLTSTNGSGGGVDNNTSTSVQEGQILQQTNAQLAMTQPDSAVAMNKAFEQNSYLCAMDSAMACVLDPNLRDNFGPTNWIIVSAVSESTTFARTVLTKSSEGQEVIGLELRADEFVVVRLMAANPAGASELVDTRWPSEPIDLSAFPQTVFVYILD